MSDRLDFQPEDSSEDISETPSLERQDLEDATLEPESHIEQTISFEESEGIEAAFVELVNSSQGGSDEDKYRVKTKFPSILDEDDDEDDYESDWARVVSLEGDRGFYSLPDEADLPTMENTDAETGESSLADIPGVLIERKRPGSPRETVDGQLEPAAKETPDEVLQGSSESDAHDPQEHYAGVQMEQGAVLQDQDWNEDQQIDLDGKGGDAPTLDEVSGISLERKNRQTPMPNQLDDITLDGKGGDSPIDSARDGFELEGKHYLDPTENEAAQVALDGERATDHPPPEIDPNPIWRNGGERAMDHPPPEMDPDPVDSNLSDTEGISIHENRGVEAVVGRALTDPDFRQALFQEPEEALKSYALNEEETELLKTLQAENVDAIANELLERLSLESPPQGSAIEKDVLEALLEEKLQEILNPTDEIGGATHKDSWKGEA